MDVLNRPFAKRLFAHEIRGRARVAQRPGYNLASAGRPAIDQHNQWCRESACVAWPADRTQRGEITGVLVLVERYPIVQAAKHLLRIKQKAAGVVAQVEDDAFGVARQQLAQS